MTDEALFLENYHLFREGINIDVSFSYEIRRWDIQLRAKATIKTSQGTEEINRGSQCIELDKTYILFPDDPLKSFESEVTSELVIVWVNLMRTIQNYLEQQDNLMDRDSFYEYMQDKMERQKKRNKERLEK